MNEGDTSTNTEAAAAETGLDSETGGVTPADVARVTGHAVDTEVSNEEEQADAVDTGADDEAEEADPDTATDTEDGEDAADDDTAADPEADGTDDAEADPAAVPEAPTFTADFVDANGNTVTLGPDMDLEEALKDFEPTSNGQVIAILDKLGQLRAEKSDHDAQAKAQEEQAAYNEKVASIEKSFAAEVKTLQGQKRLPVTAGGKDSERLTQVYQHMAEENAKRMEAGRPLLQSVEDALNSLEGKEQREGNAQAKKDARATSRAAGAKVGGSSAPATSGAPAYPGGARNAQEAVRIMGLTK